MTEDDIPFGGKFRGLFPLSTKEEQKVRNQEFRDKNPNYFKNYHQENALRIKYYSFMRDRKIGKDRSSNETKIQKILSRKITSFCGGKKMEFTYEELLEKIGDKPKCYLTGDKIDLSKSSSYHLDHIVPKSKGGDNSLDNCQIATAEANKAKGNLTLEEFKILCKKVVNNPH